jgi:hypothetical protein
MTPLVLLDVDGVLNAVDPDPDLRVWPDYRRGRAAAGGRQWPIAWSPTVVQAVLSWREVADVHWLTTWGSLANGALRELLGLPALPVAGAPPGPSDLTAAGAGSGSDAAQGSLAAVTAAAPDALTGRWWKFDVVRERVRTEPERPVVWLDDDLAGQRDLRTWMEQHARCLLLSPTPRTGLRPDDLDLVSGFLAEHRG